MLESRWLEKPAEGMLPGSEEGDVKHIEGEGEEQLLGA